jgi:hypothetical protein
VKRSVARSTFRYLAFASLASLALSSPALAAPTDTAQAKEAYDRGLEAHRRGDVQKAAEEFAQADTLAPSPVALQAALDATLEADDAPLGAELLERSKREPAPPALASSVTAAHLKWSGRTGRLRVVCPKVPTCDVEIDDRAAPADKIVWARTGQHTVLVQMDGTSQTKLVDLGPDQILEVSFARGGRAPLARPLSAEAAARATSGESSAPSRRTASEGLPPIFVYAGAGLTVVLATVTTYFALEAASSHRDFKDADCARANFAPCQGLRDDGESNQTATNVALGLTMVTAIATAVVGIGFTNWKGPTFGVRQDGASATWRVAF